jgi:alpha-beta hydrolase superfamily lysophospholipase
MIGDVLVNGIPLRFDHEHVSSTGRRCELFQQSSFARFGNGNIVPMNDTDSTSSGLVNSEGPFKAPGGQLYRRSIRPEKEPVARLAIVHGYGDHSGRHFHFMQWMAERGFACDAFDLRGQGLSDGRRGYVRRWEDYLDDLTTFLSILNSGDSSGTPLFVLGHSHGGLVVAAAGEEGLLESAGVRGVILTSPYFRSRMKISLRKILLGRMVAPFVPWMPFPTGLTNDGMSSDPAMVAQSGADPLITRVATPRWYLAHLRTQRRVMDRAANFHLPLLVLAAGDDIVANPDASEEFVRHVASKDRRFRLCPGQKHELLRETGRFEIFEEILAWIRSHL